jgi:hypothetical protein
MSLKTEIQHSTHSINGYKRKNLFRDGILLFFWIQMMIRMSFGGLTYLGFGGLDRGNIAAVF